MSELYQKCDKQIKESIKAYSSDINHWMFSKCSTRKQMHACAQYPAMMVPEMQKELLLAITHSVPETKLVYEPFVGSGTVMTETMKLGLDFVGQDINPLAVLLCRAKSGPFFDNALDEKSKELLAVISEDTKSNVETDFDEVGKWFTPNVAQELSKIRRAIRKEKTLWGRRFFWMALAETVRLTSNSRTTTYKLHIRPQNQISNRNISPIKLFSDLINKNLTNLRDQKKALQESGLIKNGRCKSQIEIKLGSSMISQSGLSSKIQCDLMVTSPSYGDNRTTVSYGQFSFLPLQWIDLMDIDQNADETYLSSFYEIDKRSLGGTLKGALNEISDLLDISMTLRKAMTQLKTGTGDGASRVASFWRDMNQSLISILSRIKPNGYMVWVVGNRSVARNQIYMDKIMIELLTAYGAVLVEKFKRVIPSKRMASRNNFSKTIDKEIILIMRKKY